MNSTASAGKAAALRPVVGQEVNLVVLGRDEVELLRANVIFDRGRGVVLDASEPLKSKQSRGRPVLVVYAKAQGIYFFKGTIAEVISKTRFYICPFQEPQEMEKREYIRAVVRLPALLSKSPHDSSMPQENVSVELSASGFRWFGALDAVEGDRVWLTLEAPERMVLEGKVLRCTSGPFGPEVAGVFTSLSQTDREALLRLVFRSCLNEIGIPDLDRW